MKNTNANRFLPLPPTSYKCPFSEEARTCQSNPFDTYLNSLPCPTNGDHFKSPRLEELYRGDWSAIMAAQISK